ncbi:D(1B) dopamine receptor [Anolis carolinensis]|uniref:D(1B) dopamine receptor n=1 Tax=Anolis carolinensis TaxID=28377 RepID=UPI002F2B620F
MGPRVGRWEERGAPVVRSAPWEGKKKEEEEEEESPAPSPTPPPGAMPWGRNATPSWSPSLPSTPRPTLLLLPASEAPASPPGPPVAQKVAAGGLLSLLVVWTLLGNALVCAAILGSRHLRAKVTNIFIVSLAISDLLVALLVMPWKAAAEVAGYWPFGAFCSIWVAFDIMCSTASILNLCVISLDRYWAIASPFRYERKMTPKVALAMAGLAWALALLVSFVPVQLNWHKGQETVATPSAPSFTISSPSSSSWIPGEGSEVLPAKEHCDSSLNRTYAIASSLISFYIPVAIMIATYTRIYRIAQVQIRRISSLERAAQHAQSCRSHHGSASPLPHHPLQHPHHRPHSSIRKEAKVLKTLSVIMGVFVCCWLPFFVLNCLVPFCQRPPDLPCVSGATFNVFVWFGWANSSLNPIIYAFNADFRRVFSHLLGCHQRGSSAAGDTANASRELLSFAPERPRTVDPEFFDGVPCISPELERAPEVVCELKATPCTSGCLL